MVQRESMIPVCLARSWRHRKTGLLPCASSLPYPPVFVLRGASSAREVCLGETVFESTRLGRSEAVFFTGDTVFLDGAAFPPGQFITDVLNLDSEALTG